MKIYLTRLYRFSASHRLHNHALGKEENAVLYGKCNNAYGHGHNYVLEVTVAGPVNPKTGMVMDLVELDGSVRQEVLQRFDHVNLNLDVDYFRAQVPTTENLCRYIFDLLKPRIEGSPTGGPVRLARIRLEETGSNFFEYAG